MHVVIFNLKRKKYINRQFFNLFTYGDAIFSISGRNKTRKQKYNYNMSMVGAF